MIDVDFYVGERLIARGKWAYLPLPGMTLRLELSAGAELYEVLASEGVGVTLERSRSTGVVPVLHCRAVRVSVAPKVTVPDSPSDWTGR